MASELHGPVGDPRVRLFVTICFMVCVAAAPGKAWPGLAVQVGFLVGAAGAWRVAPRLLLVRLAPVSGLAIAALAGMAFGADPLSAAELALRLILISAAAGVLTSSMPTSLLLSALRSAGTPATLTSLLILTGRYLTVMVREALNVRRAWQARASGRPDLRQLVALTRGALGLARRALERSDRIAWAMGARGFTGQLPCRPLPRLRVLDAGEGVAVATVLAAASFWR